jgi:hypothetical protein
LQRIKTLDGYVIPLAIKDGLARLDIRPYTDKEWEDLPHVFLTAENRWDPSVLDHDFQGDEQWFDAISDLETDPYTNLFDQIGNYRNRVIVQESHVSPNNDEFLDAHATDVEDHNVDIPVGDLDDPPDDTTTPKLKPRIVTSKTPDYAALRPLFGWLSTEIIQKSFEKTMEYARIPTGTMLKRTFQSPFPALNVHHCNESVACDIVYADVPAIDDGSEAAVIFCGTDTQVTDIYGIKSDKQFVNTLEDNIRQRGAPNKLISDRAQVEISKKVLDILRTFCISDWQSEPYQQQQNPSERRYQTVKNTANRIMDRTGAPSNTWLHCLVYVCYLLNHTYNVTIQDIPLQLLTGTTVDISPLLRFHFWQKVYYKHADTSFPSESSEGIGHIVGISEHCGHAMTWKVLTSDTNKVIYRSLVRPFSASDPNFRAVLPGGEHDAPLFDPVIKSKLDISGPMQAPPDTVFNPADHVGLTFLLDKQEDGKQFRARIVKLLEDHENNVENNPTRLKFVLSVNDDQAQEVITYNKLLEYLAHDEEQDLVWKFHCITSHQGPLSPNHPDYSKGSQYNVLVEWETGEITPAEPL